MPYEHKRKKWKREGSKAICRGLKRRILPSQRRQGSLSVCTNGFCWHPGRMQQGKQVLVNNSGSVIFSAFWFLFGTKCSTVKTFWKPSFWERQI